MRSGITNEIPVKQQIKFFPIFDIAIIITAKPKLILNLIKIK